MATLPTVPSFTSNDSSITKLQQLSQAVSFLVDRDVTPTWHLYKTATAAITAGSYTPVGMSHWIFDSDDDENGNGVTINTQGYYKTEACLQIIATASAFQINSNFQVTFGSSNPHFTNGTTKVYGSRGTSTSSENTVDSARVITAICPYVLYPGDQIIPQIKVGTSSTLDNNSNTNYIKGRFVCNFTGKWISTGT